MNKIHFTQDQINDIIKLYTQNWMKADDIGCKYNVSGCLIIRILKDNSITIRRRGGRKYRVNVNFFENIDTEEKAYWLGFLYADGYNCEKRHYSSTVAGKRRMPST